MTIIKHLRQSLEHLFDFTEDFEFEGHTYPLYGRYYRRNSKYFAVKRAELYAYASFEHLLYEKIDGELTRAAFAALVDGIKRGLNDLIKPNDEHMSSIVSIIIECDGVQDGLQNELMNFRYRKTYKWGLWGWVDFKVLVIVNEGGRQSFIESKLAKGDAKRLSLAED